MGNYGSRGYTHLDPGPGWYDPDAREGDVINPEPERPDAVPEEGSSRGQTLSWDAEVRRWSSFTTDRARRLAEKERREADRRAREAHAKEERRKRRRKMEQRARREATGGGASGTGGAHVRAEPEYMEGECRRARTGQYYRRSRVVQPRGTRMQWVQCRPPDDVWDRWKPLSL